MDVPLPTCCPSEDKEFALGFDGARGYDTAAGAWLCRTCSTVTVVAL